MSIPSQTLNVEFGTDAHPEASNRLEGVESVDVFWYLSYILDIRSDPGAPRVRFVGCHITLEVFRVDYTTEVIPRPIWDISRAFRAASTLL